MTAAAVRTRGLTKRFGVRDSGVLAVDGLDLDIPAGSVFGLLGPNGAGKTTTIRMLTGLARPTAGEASIDGVTVRPDDATIRRSIGLLDQAPRFYGWMTGRELVEFSGRLTGLTGTMLRDRASEVLERVGLSDVAGRRIAGYSGGMRQRLGIAAALAGEPSLVILDEPVSSLDPEGRRDLLALVGELRADATVIVSTHVLDDVERVCDRVAILDQGRLVVTAPLDELLTRYAAAAYRLEATATTDQAALGALQRTLDGASWCAGVTTHGHELVVAVRDETAAADDILPLIVTSGVRLIRFERVRPSLEEVFLALVGHAPTERVA